MNCESLICRLTSTWLPDIVVVFYFPGQTFLQVGFFADRENKT